VYAATFWSTMFPTTASQMSELVAEISAVEREHSLGVRILSGADRNLVRERVRSRFPSRGPWMWETVSDCASVQSPDGWRWISRFVGSQACILLFDVDEEVEMFHIPSGGALESLLTNTYGFEFYVTDVDANYLICFNHHDMLICCGSARVWLEELNGIP
jgi:hypothetical protein